MFVQDPQAQPWQVFGHFLTEGKVFTLNNSLTLGTHPAAAFNLSLAPEYLYSGFLHDPEYFLLSNNPVVVPKVLVFLCNTEQ